MFVLATRPSTFISNCGIAEYFLTMCATSFALSHLTYSKNSFASVKDTKNSVINCKRHNRLE